MYNGFINVYVDLVVISPESCEKQNDLSARTKCKI